MVLFKKRLGARLRGDKSVSSLGWPQMIAIAAAMPLLTLVGSLGYVAVVKKAHGHIAMSQSPIVLGGEANATERKRQVKLTRSSDGQFWTDVWVNGQRVRMMVDTGATTVMLNWSDANRVMGAISKQAKKGEAAYLQLKRFTFARGVGGDVPVAEVVFNELRIGDVGGRHVPAILSLKLEKDRPTPSLLGMSWLKTLARIELAGDTLILEQ